MCHWLTTDARFWSKLFITDQQCAERVRRAGCPHCGGKLHVANYPRKPRGVRREVLGCEYAIRLSFCCARCRRRVTPPSVRFLGPKVYLGAIITALSAFSGGLESAERQVLIEQLDVPAQTLYRWRHWFSVTLPSSACWRALSGWFSPPIDPAGLPGELLGRLHSDDSGTCLSRFLSLVAPLTTGSCSHSMRDVMSTQKM